VKVPQITVFVTLLGLFCLASAPVASGELNLFKKKKEPTPQPKELDTVVRAQIYLDLQNFGPGKIDGLGGEFTSKALAHYNFKHGEEHGDWTRVLEQSAKAVPNIYRGYKIRPEDTKFVDSSLPFKPSQQEKFKYMSYRSLLEFVSERFHCAESLLQKVNTGKNLNRLKPGDIVMVPNVTEFRIEDVKSHEKYPEDPVLSARQVIVDTKQKLAAIWEGEDLIATFPITPGQKKFIHYGDWKVVIMVTTPEFRYDKQMLSQGKRSDEYYTIPPGPNSLVGLFWAGLNKSGIGLHGTSSPGSIGRSQSAGCIRLSNWDAVRLHSFFRPGTKVEIR
jgi:lipoprotein-anchoring transpeptidase ErfK/SrfK